MTIGLKTCRTGVKSWVLENKTNKQKKSLYCQKSKIFTFPGKYSGFHYCLMSRPAVAVSSPLNTVFIRRPLHRRCHFILRQMLSKKVDYAHMVSKDMKQLDTTNDTEMNAEQCHVCSKQNKTAQVFSSEEI